MKIATGDSVLVEIDGFDCSPNEIVILDNKGNKLFSIEKCSGGKSIMICSHFNNLNIKPKFCSSIELSCVK